MRSVESISNESVIHVRFEEGRGSGGGQGIVEVVKVLHTGRTSRLGSGVGFGYGFQFIENAKAELLIAV